MNLCGIVEIARNSYVSISPEPKPMFSKKKIDSSFCPRWPSQSKHRMEIRGYHTHSRMGITPADTLSSVTNQWAQETPTKIQTVLKKISKRGGGVPHMSFKSPMSWGGGQCICTFNHIQKCTNNIHAG